MRTDDAAPEIPGLRIVRPLGHGGMGTVFLALDAVSHRTVALKVMAPNSDPHARERFAQEIEAVSSIRDIHIVRLLRSGVADGRPFAVFERVRGHSMARIGPQRPPVVVGLGQQLADGVAAVHAAGWIHRDLKRANVMVGDHGLVTLIDFGLAKRWNARDAFGKPSESDPGYTQAGHVVGTPRYLAPESRHGRPATPATDIYAVGLILHELLGGFVDEAGRLDRAPTGIPLALAEIIARALSHTPSRRPSADELATELALLPAARGVFRTHAGDEVPTWPSTADRRPTFSGGVGREARQGRA